MFYADYMSKDDVEYVKEILTYPKLYASTGREEDFLRGIDKTQIEKVLEDLEKYRQLYINVSAMCLNNSISQMKKHDEQLEALNEGWKIECEKKDQIIDIMAEELAEQYNNYEPCYMCIYNEIADCSAFQKCEDCIKQYCERKVKDERRRNNKKY